MGGSWSDLRETHPNATLSTTCPTWTAVVLNLGPPSKRLAAK